MSYVCVCGLNDGANVLARERVCVFTLLNNNDCNVTHSNTGLFRKKCISEPQALTPARHRFDFSSPVAIDLPQNPEQTSCKVNQQHPTTPPAVDTPQVTLLAAVCVWLSLSITRTRCFEPPFTTALKHEGFLKVTVAAVRAATKLNVSHRCEYGRKRFCRARCLFLGSMSTVCPVS